MEFPIFLLGNFTTLSTVFWQILPPPIHMAIQDHAGITDAYYLNGFILN